MTVWVVALACVGTVLLSGGDPVSAERWRAVGVRASDAGVRVGRATVEGRASAPVVQASLCLGAGAALGVVVGGPGPAAIGWGAAIAAAAWWAVRRAPRAAARRADRAVAADLPFLVLLLAAGLRAGGSADVALRAAQQACPGPAAERLRPLTARLAWGVDPAEVWADLALDPALGALGRRLGRSHRTGVSVADAVADLATELAVRRRSEVEDLARGVGVRAALPLGLCLLPAFLLLGIVPVVAGLIGQLAWQ
ncbi:type II secretion system F family protein [Nocardioides sp. Y6]|uniref:Type II secretion system F family protein n=1 Tax=Nocardioides malaquae TaxID=2773426 RepID=A0ABR9RV07_9ACTN|nr:type II secretion system F family protein [Nocardioides malaquae]MBE7325433.1 type II secretion system F family protein [Nocardioides malaquae]